MFSCIIHMHRALALSLGAGLVTFAMSSCKRKSPIHSAVEDIVFRESSGSFLILLDASDSDQEADRRIKAYQCDMHAPEMLALLSRTSVSITEKENAIFRYCQSGGRFFWKLLKEFRLQNLVAFLAAHERPAMESLGAEARQRAGYLNEEIRKAQMEVGERTTSTDQLRGEILALQQHINNLATVAHEESQSSGELIRVESKHRLGLFLVKERVSRVMTPAEERAYNSIRQRNQDFEQKLGALKTALAGNDVAFKEIARHDQELNDLMNYMDRVATCIEDWLALRESALLAVLGKETADFWYSADAPRQSLDTVDVYNRECLRLIQREVAARQMSHGDGAKSALAGVYQAFLRPEEAWKLVLQFVRERS